MDAYKNETIAFAKAVAEDLPAPVTGQDGVEALRLALACGKSLMEERNVEMSEIQKEL